MGSLGAVLTADIVNSTQVEKRDFNALTRKLKLLINQEKGKFLFYRGDSFQCYLEDPLPAFVLALKLRAAAKDFGTEGTDLRLSVGLGAIDKPVTRINEATGTAFIISGRELDNLEENGRRFIIKSDNAPINVALDTISQFTDYLYGGMTIKQVDVLRHLLNGRTQQQIARSLRKSQSTVNRHSQALGWNEIERLLGNYSKCIEIITKQ